MSAGERVVLPCGCDSAGAFCAEGERLAHDWAWAVMCLSDEDADAAHAALLAHLGEPDAMDGGA